jgi:hypothetical protein
MVNPSDIPWWAWLLCAVVLLAVAVVSLRIRYDRDWVFLFPLEVIGWIGGILCLIVGAVRLVRWAWIG